VYGIVTQAGGDVRIDSVSGAGTTMTVLLPAAQPDTTRPAPAEHAPSHHRGGETVLLVEDEAALREVTRRMLERNAYRVLLAADGDEAVKVATSYTGPIDLLLTDVVMPGLPGRELAAALADRRPDLHVVYMSGYARPALAAQGTLAPDAVLVEKPYTERMLLARLREALDQAIEARPQAR
jgi:two-component system cell cycle sensor histidine kinase/response regulator CckA